MDLTGEYHIAAPREAVWRALNDPDILKQCIPGCEEIQKVSDTEMTAKVKARVGPVSANFSGKVTLSDLDPPNGYKISGEGQGGVAGFAKGSAEVKLRPDEAGTGTILNYKVDASVGGKLAQIGSRLIEGTSRQLADQFFSNFAARVGAPAAAAVAPGEVPTAAAAPVPAAPPQRGLKPVVWVSGLIAIVIILLLIFALR